MCITSTVGLEVAPQGRRVGERQLRVRAAAHGGQDALDVADAALLDDRDVARSVAHDLVNGRAEDGFIGALAAAAGRPSRR